MLFLDRTTQTLKMFILLKLTYKFNPILVPIKIGTELFWGLNRLILKFLWEINIKNIPLKLCKGRGMRSIIKAVGFLHMKRQTYQHRKVNPKIDTTLRGNLLRYINEIRSTG